MCQYISYHLISDIMSDSMLDGLRIESDFMEITRRKECSPNPNKLLYPRTLNETQTCRNIRVVEGVTASTEEYHRGGTRCLFLKMGPQNHPFFVRCLMGELLNFLLVLGYPLKNDPIWRNIMKHPDSYRKKIQEHAGGWLFQNVSKMLDHLAGLVVLICLTNVFQYVFPKTELQNKRNYFPDRWWSRSIFISMVALWMGKCHALNTFF